MRKFFIALLLGITFFPVANAWRRTQPIYSFTLSERVKSSRYTSSRWRTSRNPHQYRFSRQFKRTDRLLWRDIVPQEISDEQIEAPIPKDFCNYHNSIIGEYLPSQEVKNRCCVCLDGWKCQHSVVAIGEQLDCDPDWEPPNTTGEE